MFYLRLCLIREDRKGRGKTQKSQCIVNMKLRANKKVYLDVSEKIKFDVFKPFLQLAPISKGSLCPQILYILIIKSLFSFL